MSENLAGSISVALNLVLTDPNSVSTPKDEMPFKWKWKIVSGVADKQADRLFYKKATIAASGQDILDLVGSLTSKFGNLFSPTKIKAILVYASPLNTNDVIIGNTAAAQFLAGFGAAAHQWSVKPGQLFLATCNTAAGWACAGGSTDNLRIQNSAGGSSVDYTIALVAASA